MRKKIVILNGSPRKGGNTALLCEAFVDGATSSGHSVNRFDLQQMNIHGCIGCMKGGKDAASPCVQKDDMDKIYPAYKDADIVVLASPMYYWSITAQLKAAFDRLFAVAETDANCRNPRKDCIMLMAAEGDSETNWKPVLDYYTALLSHLGWKDRGTVLAGGVMNVGDIKGHKSLEKARKLGAAIS
jgi:multimeric flavodoxin WrbA